MSVDPLDNVFELASRRPIQTAEELVGLTLDIGSDVEIARRVTEDLEAAFGTIVFCEGEFWRYVGTHWEAFTIEQLSLAVHRYDGAQYETAKGDPANVKLGSGRVKSILASMCHAIADRRFFSNSRVGINCMSGFIVFDQHGAPSLEPHAPEHRARHVLPGRWPIETTDEKYVNSLLRRLLTGCFKGDEEANTKISFIGEIMGCTALGIATKLKKPKAIVLHGETAENGKSQVVELFRAVLPASAVSAIRLTSFADETKACHLVGKLLNATDELAIGSAVASESFKQIVTGEPMDVRDVYKSAFELRAIAQHVFATNSLPTFKGGMDRGVRRRLGMIVFNRTIPMEERVEGIGARIAVEEADLVLAMAVRGATRVVTNGGFTEPASSVAALNEWIFASDPVLAWLESESVSYTQGDFVPKTYTKVAYDKFQRWALDQGFKGLPASNGFTQRVMASGRNITKAREAAGPYFRGIACTGPGMNDQRWFSQ